MPLTLVWLVALPLLILITLLIYRRFPPTYNTPTVVSVCCSPDHKFSKVTQQSINLIAGLGIEGDAHLGTTVQHLSRMHINPPPANLRQVHLIASETLTPLGLKAGDIGENICTMGIDLLGLARGTRLSFVPDGTTKEYLSLPEWKSNLENQLDSAPSIIIQGLRNPCPQIEKFRPGLQEQFIERDVDRRIVGRKAGVMATVERGGIIRPGMKIVVEMPDEPRIALEVV